MRERLIEKHVCEVARQRGFLVHPKAGAGRRGWPDRTFTTPERIILVEFKAAGRKPTPLQTHIYRQLKAQGYDVHVIDSVEAGTALFA